MITAAVLLAGALSSGVASRQEVEDGWDIQRVRENAISASIGFENGAGLMAQCVDGRLTLAVLGLPPAPRGAEHPGYRTLETGFDSNDLDDRSWQAETGSSIAAVAGAARHIRALRQGGVFIVRIPADGASRQPQRIDLPLPSNPAGLDAVLTACGKPLVEPRDDLPDVADLLVSPRWATHPFEFRDDVPSGTRVHVSCVIAPAGRVQDCRVEDENTPGAGAILLRDERSVRLAFGENADRAVGGIIYMIVSRGQVR